MTFLSCGRHLGRLCLAAALLLAALAPLGPAAAEAPQFQRRDSRNTPGAFDFYVLSLSWSPTWCEDQGRRAAQEAQCSLARPFAFVVHGLWPQYERGAPRDCQRPAPYVPNAVINGMLDIMPSRGLVLHQWRAHGTCSGLEARSFFQLTRAARAKVVIPDQFHRLRDYLITSPAEVEAAFQAANPGLRSDMMSVQCDNRRLTEVRICMTRDLGFRPCPDVARRACRLPRVVMPPVRGGA